MRRTPYPPMLSRYRDLLIGDNKKAFVLALEAIMEIETGLSEDISPNLPIRGSFHGRLNDAFCWQDSHQGHSYWEAIYNPAGSDGYTSEEVSIRKVLEKHPDHLEVHKDFLEMLSIHSNFRRPNPDTAEFLQNFQSFYCRFFDENYVVSESTLLALSNSPYGSMNSFVQELLQPSGIVSSLWIEQFYDQPTLLKRMVMLLEASYQYKRKQSNNNSTSIPNPMETILLTDGLRAGETVPTAEAVMLSHDLYNGADDGLAYCHTSDEVVTLCEESSFAGAVVLLSDAVSTMDGYVDVSEATVVDYSDHLALPVLESRAYDYDLVRDSSYSRRWIHPQADEVVEVVIDSSGTCGYAMIGNTVYCEDNDTYYINSDVAENHGVNYSSRHDRYVLTKKYLANYSQLSDVFKTKPSTMVSFGVEIEKEDAEALESATYQEVYDKYGWAKERDGSLDDEEGFEFVSPVYDLFDLEAFNKDVANPTIQDHINAEYSERCGGHFTVSVKGMSSDELCNGLRAFFPLLYSLYPDRCSVDYSAAKKALDLIISPTKYSAVYIKSDKLVEFRIFPAVENLTDLRWRISLMQFMIRNYGASEKQVHNMMIKKGSPLNTLLRTYCRRNGFGISEFILGLSLDYINNVKKYNLLNLRPALANL